ncbi:MAG: type III pantothenate kinase [Candidatus Margulisiibacteriota bacterium]
MLLAVDIGNTNTVAGIFNGKTLVKTLRFETMSNFQYPMSNFRKYKISRAVISSVVPSLDKKMAKIVKQLFGVRPYFVNAGTFRGLMGIKLKKPKEIGADRLVNVYAARRQYGKPLIVIDFGTATTFCAVDKNGAYLGGAIAPGVNLSRSSLHEKTAKLPLIDLKFPKKVIGDDTVSAMRSGIFWGYVGITEKMVALFRKKLGKGAKVIATGGLAGIISDKTDIIDVVEPNLTLIGLRMIGEINGGRS